MVADARARRSLGRGERIFATFAFPLSVLLTLVGAHRMMVTGIAPELAILPFVVGVSVFIAGAERIIPWHRSWLHSRGDLRTDIGLYLTNALVALLLNPAVTIAATATGIWLAAATGSDLWPARLPLPVQLALALVLAEFVEYSLHRAMHEVPWLWRFHATHHSAPRLYWLNAARFHPIDLFLVGTIKIIPVALLGAGAPVIALVHLFSAVHGPFQHANVPVRIGPLNWIFSMAELHRWHHSKKIAEANHNYGGNLICWDVLFGTRFLPEDRDPPEEIGIESLPGFPTDLWGNLLAPFRWPRIDAAAAPAAAAQVSSARVKFVDSGGGA